jgi:hypothetical protein
MTMLSMPELTRDVQRFASDSSWGVRQVMFVLVQKYLLYGGEHHTESLTHPGVELVLLSTLFDSDSGVELALLITLFDLESCTRPWSRSEDELALMTATFDVEPVLSVRGTDPGL